MTDAETKLFNKEQISEQASMWIAKLNNDEPPSPQVREELRQWMAQSPAHKAELKQMAKLWGELNVLTELAVVSPELAHKNLADDKLTANKPGIKPKAFIPQSGFSIALLFNRYSVGAITCAAILMLVIVVAPNRFTASPAVFYATAVGEQRLITLADGSTVLLNTNSQLTVDYERDARNIYLTQGQGHFEVESNPDRPFKVYAGNGMVRAVGTAFTVYVQPKNIEVTVTEGVVELNSIELNNIELNAYEKNPADNDSANQPSKLKLKTSEPVVREVLAVVKAGQHVLLSQASQSIDLLETVSDEVIANKLSWHQGMLRFSGESLAQVIKEVGRYTDVSIEIIDPALGDLRIGGFFKVGDTEKMFEALSSNFGVHVDRVSEGRVLLSAAPLISQ